MDKTPTSGMLLGKKIYEGRRIDTDDALSLFSWDLIELGRAADFRREMATPGKKVGFIIDRIINYTNICEAKCAFCAFHAKGGRIKPYELSMETICRKVEELVAAGGTQIMLQGGLHPNHTIDTYVAMAETVRKRFPSIYLHSFSPAELVHVSKKSNLTIHETVSRLKACGLNSIPGASDLLVDRIRNRVSPNKITREEWCRVMQALGRHGMWSTATMTYGMGETLQERISHLSVIRDIQDRTGVLRAFIPWSFSPAHTRMDTVQPATGMDYLKIVAVSRIFLDNIKYIQAGWLTEGLKLAQIALTMGANDMGGVLTEELVVKATGIDTKAGMQVFIDVIKNAGKIPVQRDSEYHGIKVFQDD
jgi:cyclic dehypoxanthinyl futalosine synthase